MNIPEDTRDSSSPVWDMSQERSFIEQLLNQRFNFFIAFYSIVMGGFLNSKNQGHGLIILFVGVVVCFFLMLVIYRAHKKLDLILNHLKCDETHPYSIINKRAEGYSVRWLTGYLIPIFCLISMVVCFFLSIFRLI